MSTKVIKRLAVVFVAAIALVAGSSAAASANGWQRPNASTNLALEDNGWQSATSDPEATRLNNGWQ